MHCKSLRLIEENGTINCQRESARVLMYEVVCLISVICKGLTFGGHRVKSGYFGHQVNSDSGLVSFIS